jgi:hypothetical protein
VIDFNYIKEKINESRKNMYDAKTEWDMAYWEGRMYTWEDVLEILETQSYEK